jgi:hypothetical protein
MTHLRGAPPTKFSFKFAEQLRKLYQKKNRKKTQEFKIESAAQSSQASLLTGLGLIGLSFLFQKALRIPYRNISSSIFHDEVFLNFFSFSPFFQVPKSTVCRQ